MKNLLIVDDQRDMLLLLDYYFRSNGYAVTTAYSGADGCEIARSRIFDLALVDWQMPGMDGVAVCRRLTADAAAAHRNIGVWLMTGCDPSLVKAEAESAGARAVLAKPLNPARVLALFEEYLHEYSHSSNRA
jgi:two-component system response regulator VanR